MTLIGELPDEDVQLARTVKEFATEVVAPVAARHDAVAVRQTLVRARPV